jgi:plastocyanin
MHAIPSPSAGALLFATLTFAGTAALHHTPGDPTAVSAKLSEWKVELSQPSVTAGNVTFTVTNTGTVPHAFEVEGQGIEKETEVIQPGSSASLKLTLKPGNYDVYCPVGGDSHKHLGMETHLKVVSAKGASASSYGAAAASASPNHDVSEAAPTVHAIGVLGAGPVIQILPGPFPFPDSAAPILRQFGDEREGLESQVKDGPYSNNVSPITGTFRFTAWDKGAVRDSVDGIAEFTAQDGARWKLALDRVQTKDVLHHPRFGGVIMGLYYHGNTAVHTPLVPTINSAVALWAVGHLFKNETLVTDNAMVHVMLLSRTRRDGDFALDCWNCSKNKIEELQLQILPGPGEPKLDAPGGFLFVNWEKSSSLNPVN